MLPRDVKQSRCRRINPELSGDVPGLDEVKKMPALQEIVRLMLRNDKHINEVALQLVATSFFYQYMDPISERLSGDFLSHGEFLLTYLKIGTHLVGRIVCRLPPGSREVSALGGFLKRRAAKFGQPIFVVLEPGQPKTHANIIKIPHDTVEHMVRKGEFIMPRTLQIFIANRNVQTDIRLRLADGPDATFSISGFPRSLFEDEKPAPGESLSASSRSHSANVIQRLIKGLSRTQIDGLERPFEAKIVMAGSLPIPLICAPQHQCQTSRLSSRPKCKVRS